MADKMGATQQAAPVGLPMDILGVDKSDFHGLTENRQEILKVLAQGRKRPKQVSEIVGKNSSAVVKSLQRMEEDDLVTEDHTVYGPGGEEIDIEGVSTYSLTEKGMALALMTAPPNGWTEDEIRDAFDQFLTKKGIEDGDKRDQVIEQLRELWKEVERLRDLMDS